MMNRYLAGAIAGTLATVPMTIVMEILFRRLPRQQQYPLPPREITVAVARRAGVAEAMDENTRVGASLAAHFGYGLLTGAIYPLTERGPLREHPVAYGSVYGVTIWALSYLGWIPAAGILAPATRHPRQRRRLMIAAHVVWGAGTALIVRRLAGGAAPVDLDRRRRTHQGLVQRPRNIGLAR